MRYFAGSVRQILCGLVTTGWYRLLEAGDMTFLYRLLKYRTKPQATIGVLLRMPTTLTMRGSSISTMATRTTTISPITIMCVV